MSLHTPPVHPREFGPPQLVHRRASARPLLPLKRPWGVDDARVSSPMLTPACLVLESHAFRPGGAEMAEIRAKNCGTPEAPPPAARRPRAAPRGQDTPVRGLAAMASDISSPPWTRVSGTARTEQGGPGQARLLNRHGRSNLGVGSSGSYASWMIVVVPGRFEFA